MTKERIIDIDFNSLGMPLFSCKHLKHTEIFAPKDSLCQACIKIIIKRLEKILP